VAGAFAVKVFARVHIKHPVQFDFDAQCWRFTRFNRAASGLRLVVEDRILTPVFPVTL
jgi:hypothetical protein